jgi:hypothetical protein
MSQILVSEAGGIPPAATQFLDQKASRTINLKDQS